MCLLSLSFSSFRKRMTTDIFIYRRVCLFYLKTTRNYSSFKQLSTFRKNISKLKIFLPFAGRMLQKTSTRKKADEDEDRKKSNSSS